jgi:hypothetical protein
MREILLHEQARIVHNKTVWIRPLARLDALRKLGLSGRLASWVIASALSIGVCLAVYLHPRHPHKDGSSRGEGFVVIGFLLAGAIWLVLRAGIWLARRASPKHNDDVLAGGGTWAVCLVLTGAWVAYRASHTHMGLTGITLTCSSASGSSFGRCSRSP